MSETITAERDKPGETRTPEEIRKEDAEKAKEVSDKIAQEIKDFRDNFQCERCGKCCEEGVGIALWAHEFKRLKGLIKNIYPHITFINNWYVLKLPCVFHNAKKHKCKIYDQRPIACRMYPLGVSADASTKISQNCSAVKENSNG